MYNSWKRIHFLLIQFVKKFLFSVVLPIISLFYKKNKLDERLVLFADAHFEGIPFSMNLLYMQLVKMGYKARIHCYDYRKRNIFRKLQMIIAFIKDYSSAKYIFIQDTFMPASACNHNPGALVIQLWHGCGLLKKVGYDTNEDIPKYFRTNVYANYDIVPVSSEVCIHEFERFMRLAPNIVQGIGVSRTDNYFNDKFLSDCRSEFFRIHPDAVGKKIILWAPTYRENARYARIEYFDEMIRYFNKLSSEYYPLIKLHPHIKETTPYDSIISAEYLITVADVLITDYSSILFEYLLVSKSKHLILFAPDLDDYILHRGLYIDYKSIPGTYVNKVDKIDEAIQSGNNFHIHDIESFLEKYMGACDGHATQRLISYCGIESKLVGSQD